MEFGVEDRGVMDKLRESKLTRVAAALGLSASILAGCGVESKSPGATASTTATEAGLADGECYYYAAGAYETEIDEKRTVIIRPVVEIDGDKTGSGEECAGQAPSALKPDSVVNFYTFNRETGQLEQVPAPEGHVRTRLNGGSDAAPNDTLQAIGAEPEKGDQTSENGVLTSGVLADGMHHPFACASPKDQAEVDLDRILAAGTDSMNCR